MTELMFSPATADLQDETPCTHDISAFCPSAAAKSKVHAAARAFPMGESDPRIDAGNGVTSEQPATAGAR